MEIKSAVFKKSCVNAEEAFADGLPQLAFIGRSNVGKSSTINALTKVKGLAKTSNTPGHTKQINLFLINNTFYIADLPGYGFTKQSLAGRKVLEDLIESYLFNTSHSPKKVVLIIDGKVGPTEDDLAILEALEQNGKDIIVAINKIDRLKNSELKTKIAGIKEKIGAHKTVSYSAQEKKGVAELWSEIVK